MGSEPCGQHWQTSPVSEACSICAFRVDAALATMLATMSMLQTPSAVHFSADPCHVLVATVHMVGPLLAKQRPDSSELGT